MATRTAHVTGSYGCAIDGPGFEHERQVVDGRQHEQEAVEAVEHAAVALDDRAEVLDVEVALEHALGEVAERRA